MSADLYKTLPTGRSPEPVVVPHFPSALHTVVWRNWDVIPLDTLARVLHGTPAQIAEIATSMGLPAQRPITQTELRRNYMTVLHRNWHLLPYEQLCAILDWTPERMLFGLNEDDFMWAKLGGYKPNCPRVVYQPVAEDVSCRAHEIAGIAGHHLPTLLEAGAEPPFGFIERFEQHTAGRVPLTTEAFELRMVYPYFLRYGDPLLGEGVEDMPDGYLAQLAACGVNAVWFQGVLNKLAPWHLAPELSEHWEERLANLRRLVARCHRHGIDVILYFNEPRAMPRSFFVDHPELQGVEEMPSRMAYAPDTVALCTSAPEVQEFLVNSVRHVFEQVPGLGGILSLTYSENLTNCYSRTYPQKTEDGHGTRNAYDPTSTSARNAERAACPRCLERGPEVVNAEVCSLLERGMRLAGSQGRVMLYLWSTPKEWIPGILERLPKDTRVLCVSEWGTPFTRGDYHGEVNEYSISVVGPSEQSLRQWTQARAYQLKTVAKMQAANTYEFSSIPYIPAVRRVAEHISNLAKAGVDGLMLGWTAGGSPSPNLELVAVFTETPGIGVQEALLSVATRRFGAEVAAGVRQAWNLLSDAYGEFPFDISVCYAGPQSLGPANLLYATSTGFRATMVTFPFDDLETWKGPYSTATFLQQFEKVANLWKAGVDLLDALRLCHPSAALDDEHRIAQAALIHFQSTANQIRFVQAREDDPVEARRLLEDEIALTQSLLRLVARDSRIGFEATNHYGYIGMDLIEKIINCRYLLATFAPASHA